MLHMLEEKIMKQILYLIPWILILSWNFMYTGYQRYRCTEIDEIQRTKKVATNFND